jgi:hypothetical protein
VDELNLSMVVKTSDEIGKMLRSLIRAAERQAPPIAYCPLPIA